MHVEPATEDSWKPAKNTLGPTILKLNLLYQNMIFSPLLTNKGNFGSCVEREGKNRR